jgi:hypothetical protein
VVRGVALGIGCTWIIGHTGIEAVLIPANFGVLAFSLMMTVPNQLPVTTETVWIPVIVESMLSAMSPTTSQSVTVQKASLEIQRLNVDQWDVALILNARTPKFAGMRTASMPVWPIIHVHPMPSATPRTTRPPADVHLD